MLKKKPTPLGANPYGSGHVLEVTHFRTFAAAQWQASVTLVFSSDLISVRAPSVAGLCGRAISGIIYCVDR
jgi:hypothetical protein